MVVALALAADFWIAGGLLHGQRTALHVRDGQIAALADAAPPGARVLDAAGLHLAPAVIDAHVHLSVAGELRAVAQAELQGGVAAALDLGEPERLLPQLGQLGPLRVLFAGPLCTAPGGYPTQSWGKDGYGLPLQTPEQALQAVERLAAGGAAFIKLALDPRYPLPSREVAQALVEAAHARGLKVAAHALDAAMVRRALDAGADVLAHTPVEPLPDPLVREAGTRKVWVLSTLAAFGGGAAALDNVRRLRAAGARIAYGTDLGNEGTAPGVSERELRLLHAAGLSPAEVLHAATAAPAELLGLSQLGALRPGFEASLLLLPADPARDPAALAHPRKVLVRGVLH